METEEEATKEEEEEEGEDLSLILAPLGGEWEESSFRYTEYRTHMGEGGTLIFTYYPFPLYKEGVRVSSEGYRHVGRWSKQLREDQSIRITLAEKGGAIQGQVDVFTNIRRLSSRRGHIRGIGESNVKATGRLLSLLSEAIEEGLDTLHQWSSTLLSEREDLLGREKAISRQIRNHTKGEGE